MVRLRRRLSLVFFLLMAASAALLAMQMPVPEQAFWPNVLRVGLLTINTAWLAWGTAVALNGIFALPHRRSVKSSAPVPENRRTAILVPIYNEDPVKTFSHVAAMARSLIAADAGRHFEFVILSDSTRNDIAAREAFWFSRLHAELGDAIAMFYRRRPENRAKKAGNIGDFIRASGGRYDYLVILDADSLMDAATLVEMVRRMQAEPELGLLQTLPIIMHARSFFGRAVQFSASYFSPVHALGLDRLQGDEGLFWGHNAIVRTRAFAQSCGLPELSGKPPLGGHILSHDFVEAALLVRDGWRVRLDLDLVASYEEGPDNVVDYAKRDRRWCQGNLQHIRLIGAPRLAPWSRLFFVQGIMAYLASPVWALFLIATIVTSMLTGAPDYFSEAGLPVFLATQNEQAIALLTGVLGLLVGPKILMVIAGAFSGRNRRFGGTLAVFASVIVEIILSSLLAPTMLLYQCRSVIQVILGADGGWPSTDRDASTVKLPEAWAAAWWISLIGLVTTIAAWYLAENIAWWIMLVAIPAILSPALIALTSTPASGTVAARLGLMRTPAEIAPPTILLSQSAAMSIWRDDAGATAMSEQS